MRLPPCCMQRQPTMCLTCMGVIYGAGGGSTQISAVQNGAIVGTSFYELGSKKGVKILEKCSKKDLASLKVAVEKWKNDIEVELKTWKMASSNPDIDGQNSTDFLKKNSENKTVVGISAVYYSMTGTEEINQIDKNKLPRIKQKDMVAALENKLNVLLNFTFEDGAFVTDVKTFNEKSFLTELANVQLHLSYAKLLYHPTAIFTLAREWKVNGKPFRTTWSTGWYVPACISSCTCYYRHVRYVCCADTELSSYPKGTSTI
jgi:hypothetical protein